MGEDIVARIQQQFRENVEKKDKELVSLLGNYSFERRLGESGIAVVYKVRDNNSGEHFAIKILNDNLPSDKRDIFLERFRRETSALFMLLSKYPNLNLVEVVHTAEEDGRPFYVMEFIPGKDLFYVLQEEGRLDQARAIRMATSIGDVVSCMHENGLVHRDLKPANIMVTGEGYKLIDLGVVRIVYEHDKAPVLKIYEDKPHLTAKGVILGTIGYIPPEQLLGTPADARGDIYSLGTILYTALSGMTPFEKNDLESDSSIMDRMRTQDPPSLLQVCPGVPPELSDVVAKAMNRNPNERYQTCEEFVDALSCFS